MSAGTDGFLRLQTTTGITAASTYGPLAFAANSKPELATISFQGSVANVNLALRSLEVKRTGTGTNTLMASVIDGTRAVFNGR